MQQDNEFRPNGCEVALNENGQEVRMLFEKDGGQFQAVIIPRGAVPSLIVQLQGKIEPTQAVPIDKGSMRPGSTWALQSYGVQLRPNGGALLTLYVRVDEDRGVTVPIDLSPDDCTSLVRTLSGN